MEEYWHANLLTLSTDQWGVVLVPFLLQWQNNLGKSYLEEEGFIWLTMPSYSWSLGLNHGRNLYLLIHTHKSREKWAHACSFVCAELNFSILTQCRSTCLRNGIAHSGLVPTSINLIEINSQGKYTGQSKHLTPQRDSLPGDYRLCLVGN